ncbi:cyclin-T1-3-like protein isoform X1, partial [Tanacetum coccineum]
VEEDDETGMSAYAIGFLKVSFNVDEMLNVFYVNGHLSTNMRKIPGICSPDVAFFFGKRKLIWLTFFLGTHASAYDRLTLHFWLRTSLWLQFKPHQIAAGVAYLAVLWILLRPNELQCEQSPQGLAEIETISEPVKNDSDVGPYVINYGR